MDRSDPRLPASAACRHITAKDGFEVVFMRSNAEGYRFEGCTTAVEAGETWVVRYAIDLDPGWRTRQAQVSGMSDAGTFERILEADGMGHWKIDGTPAPPLDGCLDLDLESSAFTNTFPVRRLALTVGAAAEAPAAYVRATDLRVERLEQRYARVADDAGHTQYDYASPRFDYAGRLVYDAFGLIIEYPDIAVRID